MLKSELLGSSVGEKPPSELERGDEAAFSDRIGGERGIDRERRTKVLHPSRGWEYPDRVGMAKTEIPVGSIFGVDLTDVTLTWDNAFENGVAPTTLGGVQVLYDGEPAFISFLGEANDFGVAFDQLNFVVPETNNKGAGGLVPVQVVTAGGTSAAAMVIHQALSPSFFPLAAPNVAAVHLDGTLVGPPGLFPGVTTREANPDDIVLLFGTGFGPTTPPVPVGTLPGSVLEPGVASATNQEVTICFGDEEVTPLFAGLSGFVGLYQITVTVPNLPVGDVQLLAKIGGLQTQDGISIRVGTP